MVKGVSKQVVVVKPPQSSLFEEAIFILKEDAHRKDAGEVLKEAVTVANEYVAQTCDHPPRRIPGILFSAAGALITGLAWLLVTILR